jgi:hypothetical protein
MRKCPKCSAIFDEPLNFCKACGAMLETVVEEPSQVKDNDNKDEKIAKVSSPPTSKNLFAALHPPDHLKERMNAAIDDLKDCLLDKATEAAKQADPFLTLLNLHRRPTVSHIETNFREIEGANGAGPEMTLLNLRRNTNAPDMPHAQCPTCGSTKVISDMPVRCKSSGGEIQLSIWVGTAELLADICSDCGHVKLKVQNPQDLRDSSLQSKESQ